MLACTDFASIALFGPVGSPRRCDDLAFCTFIHNRLPNRESLVSRHLIDKMLVTESLGKFIPCDIGGTLGRHPSIRKREGSLAERNIIVIGCSVGGVEALQHLVSGLSSDLPAAVLVVLHLAPQGTSVLPDILKRAGQLPAVHPKDGEAIRMGRIYVAPPDNHLLVDDGRVRIVHGPKENRHRPAVDPLFRSAARWYGPRVIGIVLTGSLDDGTAGLLSIKKCGGIAIVQDPKDAICGEMPRNALQTV